MRSHRHGLLLNRKGIQFGENFESCRDSQQYFNSIDLNLPTQVDNLKPKYGTTRALNNDLICFSHACSIY